MLSSPQQAEKTNTCSFFAKRITHFLFISVFSFSFTNCTVSRTSARLSEIGNTYYFADYSTLESPHIYEKDGEHYLLAQKAAYDCKPRLTGVFAGPLNFFGEVYTKLPDKEQTHGFIPVRISRNQALWLSGKTKKRLKTDCCSYEKYIVVPNADLVNAHLIPMKRNLPEPEILTIDTGTTFPDLPYCGVDRSFLNYAMQPVALADGVLVDVPLTVLYWLPGWCFMAWGNSQDPWNPFF